MKGMDWNQHMRPSSKGFCLIVPSRLVKAAVKGLKIQVWMHLLSATFHQHYINMQPSSGAAKPQQHFTEIKFPLR